MKHSELIQEIAKQTGKTPKQRDLAEILEKPIGTINSRASRDLNYDYEEIRDIEDFYKITLDPDRPFIDDLHDNSGEISVDYYPDVLASCGNGTFEMSQFKETIRIPKMCITDYFPFAKYSVVNAYGDSMQPTIQNRDKLVVELLQNKQIRDNQIYIFFYDGKIFVKRLIQNLDQIVVVSDNPDKKIYPTQFIKKEMMNDVHLIGRIVGLMRGMD